MKNAAKQWKLRMLGAAVALLGMIVLATYLLTPANAEESTDSVQAFAKEAQAANSEMFTAYVDDIQHENGKSYLIVDKIGWYQGAEADKVFDQRNPDSGIDGAPDGYYIVNDSKEQEKVEVSANAEVLMQLYDRDGTVSGTTIQWNESVALSKFESLYDNTNILDLSVFPYHLTVQDGKVIKIVQQYIP
ncbi:hypothetical protein [Paenibacillus sp. OK003]|uniref:hypothetical protein n=1 Tax=Paenibacillus sp. OK003 TaxID=1884380 RepID=UPI0008C825A7|nr:hypothetical protein [Paenibacillus sp. OK003]SEK26505.1 hypothetical protein SAMN05518856_101314 [Paenibacillus sp. OK003]